MATQKKEKNTVSDTTIEARGDVTIGDRKTINIYGMEATERVVNFVIKFFMALIGLFAITFLITLFLPQPKKELTDFISTFAAGGFCALIILFLVFLVRSRNQSSINIK